MKFDVGDMNSRLNLGELNGRLIPAPIRLQIGLMDLAGDATPLYCPEEANEGQKAFLERRPRDFSKVLHLP
jgi:1,4-dihydroxy-2-naphthoyl-CoA synthase